MQITDFGNSILLDLTSEEALSLIGNIAVLASNANRYVDGMASVPMPVILMGKAAGGHDAPGKLILNVRKGKS